MPSAPTLLAQTTLQGTSAKQLNPWTNGYWEPSTCIIKQAPRLSGWLWSSARSRTSSRLWQPTHCGNGKSEHWGTMHKEINIFPVFNSWRVIRSFLWSNLTIAYAMARMGILCEEAAWNSNVTNTPDTIRIWDIKHNVAFNWKLSLVNVSSWSQKSLNVILHYLPLVPMFSVEEVKVPPCRGNAKAQPTEAPKASAF